jgi:hypothetical protein
LPYPPHEQHGDQERQTPIWRPVCRALTGRPTPQLGAAADELGEAVSGSRGGHKKKVFAAQKIGKPFMRATQKFLADSLEIKNRFF